MATKASRIALAGSNISSTGEVDADLLDNIDSAAFLSLDSNGRLGIGTTTPADKMHIYNSSGTTVFRADVNSNSTVGLEINKTGSTTQSWQIADGVTHNGALQFYDATDSAVRMHINGSGHIGIGTTNPKKLLHLYGDENSGGLGIVIQDDGWGAPNGMFMTTVRNSDGAYTIRKNTATAMDFSTYTDMLSVKGDGNVGIGTASPNAGLEVLKSGGGKIRISETTDKYVEIIGYAEGAANGSTMAFHTNQSGTSTSTERMRINHNGNVGIGTTSPSRQQYGSVDPKLHVNATGTSGSYDLVARFQAGPDADNTGAAILINHGNDRGLLLEGGRELGDTGIAHFSILSAGAARERIITLKQGGNVGIGTSSPDVKLHSQIITATEWTGSANLSNTTNKPIFALLVDNNDSSITNTEVNMLFSAGASGSAQHSIGVKRSATNQGDLIFRRRTGGASSAESMRINSAGNVGIGTTNPGAKLAIKGGSTGAVNFLEFHYDDPGGDLDGIGVEEILVNYKFTDQNANNTPQVQVAAELGNPGHTDEGVISEGRGNYVVRTNDGEAGGLSDSLRVEWDGSVHMPQQPVALYYDVTANTSVAQSELIGFATASGFNRGITDSNSKTRFFVPAAGIYAVSFTVAGSVTTPSAGDGIRIIIKKNGSTYATADAYNIETVGTAAGQEYSFKDMLLVEMGINHYIELMFDNVGGTVFNANYGNLNIWKVA